MILFLFKAYVYASLYFMNLMLDTYTALATYDIFSLVFMDPEHKLLFLAVLAMRDTLLDPQYEYLNY